MSPVLLLRRYIAASALQKVHSTVCFVFGVAMAAIGMGIFNPLDPMSWCSQQNGCAFYPDNKISVWLGLSCYGASALLLWGAGSSLYGKRTALLALPVGVISLAFVVFVVERLAHAWP
jgi:hypothetical protein